MKIFDKLLQEIQEKELASQQHVNSLESFIESISSQLLDEKFHPSNALKNLLNKYKRRVKYPMEVAIVGQFSSGKSTFLNALLSKDVLPTGITPVTSKVNFLNYGKEYKLKITFKSGANEYHGIEHLAKFTDQREAIEDVKYLSIYAPVEMLKEISFVDTPGLNSQSQFDTQTTNAILRDVDGIIWLGLIDAVAKKTELDILEKYLPNYANKSVCLLNQKDRLQDDEVATALAYAKQNYKEYFSEIIAISAKQALDSRVQQKETLLFSEKHKFVEDIKTSIMFGEEQVDEEFFAKKLASYTKNIQEIKAVDYSDCMGALNDSNILKVLEFIDTSLRPKARESKVFAIKKDFSSLCKILQNEYTRITTVYVDLTEIIEDFVNSFEDKLQNLEDQISAKMELLNVNITEEISENVSSLHVSIQPITRYLIKEKKSLLGTNYEKEKYTSYSLQDSNTQTLAVGKSTQSLEAVVTYVIEQIQASLKNFEKELLLWQLQTEKIQKNREVASDEEFNNLRYFAAKIHEKTLQDYREKFDAFSRNLEHKISKYSLKNRFSLAYEKTKAQLIHEIVNMQNAYEKDPESSVINNFDESEILLMFKEHLDFNYLKREFQKDDSFIKSALDQNNQELNEVMKKSIIKIGINFSEINEKIKLLDEIESSVNIEF